MALRIKQYVYFATYSSVTTAVEMARAIGLEPDDSMVRGSRLSISGKRPVPYQHSWRVFGPREDPQLPLSDQIDRLIDRLDPVRSALLQLVNRLTQTEPGGEAGSGLSVVRYLDTEGGELDGWQHRLLGWGLDERALQFLVEMNATLDIDEYGQSLPWWRLAAKRRYARS